jgi:hypothetical protein
MTQWRKFSVGAQPSLQRNFRDIQMHIFCWKNLKNMHILWTGLKYHNQPTLVWTNALQVSEMAPNPNSYQGGCVISLPLGSKHQRTSSQFLYITTILQRTKTKQWKNQPENYSFFIKTKILSFGNQKQWFFEFKISKTWNQRLVSKANTHTTLIW